MHDVDISEVLNSKIHIYIYGREYTLYKLAEIQNPEFRELN